MNEQQKTETNIEKKTGADFDDGNQPSANSIVERADAAAERLARENERSEANIRRQEELMAKQALGGRSEINPKAVPKEETNHEFYKKFLRGEVKAPF